MNIPTLSEKPEQSQGIAPSQRFFLWLLLSQPNGQGFCYRKISDFYCPLNLYLYLGTSDSHSLALLLLRADIRSVRAFPILWQSMTSFLPETMFQEQNFYLFKGASASHDTQTAAIPRGYQFQVLWALGSNADLFLLSSSIHTPLG